jgi:hypothetical protein
MSKRDGIGTKARFQATTETVGFELKFKIRA